MEAHTAGQTKAHAIDPATSMGAVRVRVTDTDRARDFYERVIGLRSHNSDDGIVRLTAGKDAALVELEGDSSALPLDRSAPGLFHMAILLPDRSSLAMALARIASFGWPLTGASDHLVSEALYLADPEGNGIEIYRDRPREEWTYRDGQLAMSTLPLDLDSLLGELHGTSEVEEHAPPETRVGHVHLQVADLAEAEEFYAGVLGFDVTVRGYPGALFVSAGGYHHHLGLNTWNTRPGSARPPGSVGLERFEIVLGGDDALARVVKRVDESGRPMERAGSGWTCTDPSGNQLLLRTA